MTTLTAGFLAYPFDTVRKRLQVDTDLPKDQRRYTGMIDCFRKMV